MQKEKKKGSFTNWLYPPVTDKESAKKAAKQGVWASLFCVGITILVIIINAFGANLLNIDYFALIDVALFLIIAFGIYKMSRIAAVAGLLLYIWERIFMFQTQGNFGNTFQIIVIIFMYVNSIRGTFQYHKQEVSSNEQVLNTVQTIPIVEKKIICPKCGSDRIYKQQQCLNCGELIGS